MRASKNQGFTLIELMIVVAIIGLLAAVGYPSYVNHIIKSNRAAAKAQMMDIANRQQQFLLVNRSYATKAQLEASGYKLPTEVVGRYDYDITVGTSTVPAFTVTFTGLGKQAADGALTLNSEGGRGCIPACVPITTKW